MYYLNFSKICQEKNHLFFFIDEKTETQLTEKTYSRSYNLVSVDVELKTIKTIKQSKDLSQIQSYKCLGVLKHIKNVFCFVLF